MTTIWDTPKLDFESTCLKEGIGVSTVRVCLGKFGQIITVTTEQLALDEVITRFIEIKRAGNLRCRSLKLFFYGKIPTEIMREKGLLNKGVLWKLPHTGISIFAVPFGPKEWCFMIEKRNGQGVQTHLLSFLPYMEHQLKWEVLG